MENYFIKEIEKLVVILIFNEKGNFFILVL